MFVFGMRVTCGRCTPRRRGTGLREWRRLKLHASHTNASYVQKSRITAYSRRFLNDLFTNFPATGMIVCEDFGMGAWWLSVGLF